MTAQVAWVTGGGTGIGRELATQLYQQGARVIITGRRNEILQNTASEIASQKSGGEIIFMAGNAADPSHIEAVKREAGNRWGDITLLINNAASNERHLLQQTLPKEYQQAFENNCMSAIRTTYAVLPAMLKARQGSIVNISSVYGRWGTTTSATYSVSKFALAGFTEALQQDLVGSGVHALSVFPGYIKTDMTSPYVEEKTLRWYLGKSTQSMARAILSAVKRRQRDLYFPWYVPWVLRLHRWFPASADWLAQRVKR